MLHHCSAWLLLCMSLPAQLGLCQLPGLCLGWLSLTKKPFASSGCPVPLAAVHCPLPGVAQSY